MPELLSSLPWRASAERPEHPAVEDAGGGISYALLADRVGRLAAELRECGVQPGDRVGVLAPKSIQAVAGLYGIMAAGAAYVPLDAAAPTARLVYMIRNCGMKALLASAGQAQRLAGQLEGTSLRRVVLVDAEAVPEELAAELPIPLVAWGDVAGREPLGRPIDVSPDDLAYILYTSGSTGQPKGVMISHRNALAFVEWARKTVEVGPDDRLSSHAPFHFDLSVFDLYAASLAGATVVLVPEGASMFPAMLAGWIEEQRITVWYSVPSILVQMMDRGGLDRFDFQRLRKMVFAGEVFATKYLRAWMQKLGRADWFNFYGPTETNVCTYHAVSRPPADERPVSIGVAASGDTIYLRSEDGRVVTEPGVEGEIWVDGPTVAMGYWGDQAKTDARFVVDGELTGSRRRVYRTGDLACWDADGTLTFKGRRDHMIKSRGYRIELGEIESVASGHPDVNEVCVVAVPDTQLGNRIRACVVRHPGTELDRDGLERHLSQRLPQYMLPQEVLFMDSLPSTSTGKIDRVALAGGTEVR